MDGLDRLAKLMTSDPDAIRMLTMGGGQTGRIQRPVPSPGFPQRMTEPLLPEAPDMPTQPVFRGLYENLVRPMSSPLELATEVGGMAAAVPPGGWKAAQAILKARSWLRKNRPRLAKTDDPEILREALVQAERGGRPVTDRERSLRRAWRNTEDPEARQRIQDELRALPDTPDSPGGTHLTERDPRPRPRGNVGALQREARFDAGDPNSRAARRLRHIARSRDPRWQLPELKGEGRAPRSRYRAVEEPTTPRGRWERQLAEEERLRGPREAVDRDLERRGMAPDRQLTPRSEDEALGYERPDSREHDFRPPQRDPELKMESVEKELERTGYMRQPPERGRRVPQARVDAEQARVDESAVRAAGQIPDDRMPTGRTSPQMPAMNRFDQFRHEARNVPWRMNPQPDPRVTDAPAQKWSRVEDALAEMFGRGEVGKRSTTTPDAVLQNMGDTAFGHQATGLGAYGMRKGGQAFREHRQASADADEDRRLSKAERMLIRSMRPDPYDNMADLRLERRRLAPLYGRSYER